MSTDLRPQLDATLGGRYAIEREVGRGGMATVYLARDAKHERRVALKVLDPELGAVLGAARFLAEIRVTANLQHPNLLPLFDSGEAGGLLYYVMPFVDGESLRARLERERQLPVDEAARLATAVADALDYAHAHGVIHRDLKPENILLQHGQPVVADFGIALAVSNAGGQRVTQTGLSLGTPQYMSPEQATGDRVIDARSDVYALGAVTYEMLTGEPPHTGATVQAIIARVLTERAPSARAVRETVPAHVDAALQRALAKLPADRFASAGAFAAALVQPGATTRAAPTERPNATSRSARGLTRTLAAALVATTALAVWGWLRHPAPPPRPRPSRFVLAVPDSAAVNLGDAEASFAFSPDGSALVYTGGRTRSLWVRALDELTPRALPGTDAARAPEVSPDGRWVAFLVASTLKKVPLAGGEPIAVTQDVARFTWVGADSLVIARGNQPGVTLWQVSAQGGPPRLLVTPATGAGRGRYSQPAALPGGRAIVFTAFDSTGAPELAALRLDDRRVVRLGVRGTNAVYVADGFLLFFRALGLAVADRPTRAVTAVRFDAKALRVVGEPVDVLEGVMLKAGGAELAVSPDGTLAYVPGSLGARLVQADRHGATRTVLADVKGYLYPRVSPDGRQIAVAVADPPRPVSDIWVHDIASGTLTRLTNGGRNVTPRWSPDGKRVAWTVTGVSAATPTPGVWWQPPDASLPPERLTTGAGADFTPSGDAVLTNRGTVDSVDMRLVPLPPGTGGESRPILQGLSLPNARISPDGRWLAYVSQQTGVREVYVQPFPGPGGRYQVSNGGGVEPVWAPNGGTLFYRAGSSLVAASLATTPTPTVLRRDTLFTMDAPSGTVVAAYDVTPDGEHFVFPQYTGLNTPPVIVLGWADALRARLATRR